MSPVSGSAPPAVLLEGVSQRYGRTRALEDVSLAVPSGCLAGLIGPDGVGKSTLLGLVAGTRRLQQGRVEVLGGDFRSRRQRRTVLPDVAYMAQGLGTNLYPDLTVAENVDFFGRLFRLPRAWRRHRAEELLEATGLLTFRDRHVRNLSGGMKQKLGLCCALVHDPRLLVLDEPTTGIDPLSRRQFWDLIDEMRARRPELCVLVATSYMEEAERFDWLAVLDGGHVLATGRHDVLEARTGSATLEAAYVALLPEARGRTGAFSVPPRRGDGEVAVEARDLTRRFGDFTAVDGVSFRIERGEIFGFVGSNGSGKTTTMNMLTGLLPASEGEAWLLGRPVDARDREQRRRLGTTTQSFSLWRELTVRQNLELHGRLYGLPDDRLKERVPELLERFGLRELRDTRTERLPVGHRQRLALAAAVVHEPELLILDEPTSGIAPLARDRLWEELVRLSREDGVTIFLSTHFMNEAERCDRIALMHAGRVLETGAPGDITASRGARDLEDAFVAVLEEAGASPPSRAAASAPEARPPPRRAGRRGPPFDAARAFAVAYRETREVLRDRVRLGFALLGPVLLMVVNGYGISFDVNELRFAVLDRDQSPESRRYLEGFRGSRYFAERAPLTGDADLDARLARGDLTLAVEIPPRFGADLRAGNAPEASVWIDGAMPFTAETALGYAEAIHARTLEEFAREQGHDPPAPPVRVEKRFRYNQPLESVRAIVPGVIMLLLVLIPAITTAVAVVREKELGSIANFYVTPTTRLEYLLGKQLPYVAIAFLAFLMMAALAVGLFRVPLTGSFAALALGALLYVTATTGFGLLVSSFVGTQLAAIFATAILTVLPATQFSGLLMPVASLTGGARIVGHSFPCAWFQQVSLGTFAKGLHAGALLLPYAMLALFALLYLAGACALLRKQER